MQQIQTLELSKLKPYENQPFKKLSSEKFSELVASIKEMGIITPITVRPIEEGLYQILSGHNRCNACVKLGLKTVPAYVVECDDDTAAMIVVDSNLKQRENISKSEKGKAFKMQLEAIKHQGQKRPEYAGMKAEDVVAKNNGTNKDEIHRHIRLTYLIAELVDMVDSKKLPFVAGVDLSYLNQSTQQTVYKYFFADNDLRLDLRTAKAIRSLSENQKITVDTLKKMIVDMKSTTSGSNVNISLNLNSINGDKTKLPQGFELTKLINRLLEEYLLKEMAKS